MLKDRIKGNKNLYSVARFVKYRIVRPIHLSLYTAVRKFSVRMLPLSADDDRIKSLKGKYSGKTAFIIGNGPSLTASDLDMISDCGGVSFASNKIYYIFNQTKWRPDFYLAVDGALLTDKNSERFYQLFSENNCYYFFAPDVYDHLTPDIRKKENVYRFHKKRNDLYKHVTEFSPNAVEYLVDGYTVTYAALQLAYYLGFEQIVLLGVDCNYSFLRQKDGSVLKIDNKQQYFSKEYEAGSNNSANVAGMLESYQCACDYFISHGLRVYNATRGGELEVFERRSLEDICEELEENNER